MATIPRASLLVLSLAFVAPACMTSSPTPQRGSASSLPMVSRIDLSETVGHVGEKFKSKVEFHAKRLSATEMKVGSLPPGLKFDSEKQVIYGVPKSAGFYSVTVSVRKRRGKGVHFNTPGGSWFSERIDLDIYVPIEDGGDNERWDSDDVLASNDFDF